VQRVGRWLRNLAVGAAVGLAVGVVVGGTLGRAFMRLLTLAREDSRGFETAMGAIIGEVTADGTAFIYVFGGFVGLAAGLLYVLVRPVLPPRWRTLLYTAGTGGVLAGVILRANGDDFLLVPVTLGVLLVLGTVVLTALPVPVLVERFAPDRDRDPGPVALVAVAIGLIAIGVYAALGIAGAYSI
jgi:hypothetical protein